MEIVEVQEIGQLIPPGEAVSPEPTAEIPEVAAPEPDEDQEIADLQEELASASTSEDRAARQAKLNSKFAEMRRGRKEAERLADERQRLLDAAQAERDRLWQLALAKADAAAIAPDKGKEAPVEVAPVATPKPVWEDFDGSYEEFNEVLMDWKIEQREAKAAQEAKKADTERHKTTAAQEEADAVIAHGKWLTTCKAKYPDFDDVVGKPVEQGGPAISPEMVKLIKESEFSAELAYYLGKNPQESKRIYNLTSVQQAREFGKLEGKLTTKPPVKPTGAPPPIAPVGGGPGAGIDKPLEEVSTDEFVARRNREEFGPDWKRRA